MEPLGGNGSDDIGVAIGPDQVNSKGASSLALLRLLLMFLVTLLTMSIMSSGLDCLGLEP